MKVDLRLIVVCVMLYTVNTRTINWSIHCLLFVFMLYNVPCVVCTVRCNVFILYAYLLSLPPSTRLMFYRDWTIQLHLTFIYLH